MTTKASEAPPPALGTPESELYHYKPEQVVKLLGNPTTARMLREWAYERKIPHSRLGGRITFRLVHIRAISAQFDAQPLSPATPLKSAA